MTCTESPENREQRPKKHKIQLVLALERPPAVVRSQDVRTGEQDVGGRKSQTKRGRWIASRGAECLYQGSGSGRDWGPEPASGQSTREEGRHFRAGACECCRQAMSKSAWRSLAIWGSARLCRVTPATLGSHGPGRADSKLPLSCDCPSLDGLLSHL